MAESEEELKSFLKVKEESEKAGLKRLIHVNVWQNHHNKIISLQLNFFLKNSKNKDKKKQRSWQLVPSLHGKLIRKKWELSDFIFLGSKITVDGDCSHEIKRLASWKKSYDKPRQHIEKQKPKKKKDVTLLTKFCIVKTMVFQVWM